MEFFVFHFSFLLLYSCFIFGSFFFFFNLFFDVEVYFHSFIYSSEEFIRLSVDMFMRLYHVSVYLFMYRKEMDVKSVLE